MDLPIQKKVEVPKKIFQTHKSFDYIKSQPAMQNAINSWIKYIPEFEYFFYTDQMCDDFIREKMGSQIYKAYQKLPLPVMKADLWRYCVIYYYGGIYADVDTICLTDPKLFLKPDSKLMVSPENDCHLCQWCFSAIPNSPILKKVIDLSVDRIINTTEIKGEHIIHYLTGPGVFTDGIENYLRENNLPIHNENKKNYSKIKLEDIFFFNSDVFHNRLIKHLFFGQNSDGWYYERFKKLI
jgi:mannosyltransferase OCH1-like enzyme